MQKLISKYPKQYEPYPIDGKTKYCKCNKCNQVKVRDRIYDELDNPTNIYIDGEGYVWSGKVCPKCNKEKARENYKKNIRPVRKYSKIIINNCIICSKVFITKSKSSKACSSKCRSKTHSEYYSNYRKSKGKDYKHECTVCSKEFWTRRADSKTCSDECRKTEAKRKSAEQHKKNRKSKTCNTCGEKFFGKRIRYCSDKCKPKKELDSKECKRCSKTFQPKRAIQVYCSKECSSYRKTEYILKCQTCGKSMKASRPDKKYCKQNCTPSKKAYKKAEKLKIKHAKPKSISWSEIQEIYDNCPEGHHVDHIIPRNHDLVCGLHVPWNLQYLPAKDNMKKSNKFIIVEIESP